MNKTALPTKQPRAASPRGVVGRPLGCGSAFDRQRGVSLIEVMVSVLLLSIGISGGLSLLSVAIKEQSALKFKVVATQAATTLTERMRSNRLGIRQGLYADAAPTTTSDDYALAVTAAARSKIPTTNAENSCVGVDPTGRVGCQTAADLAAFDIATARQAIQSLPGGVLSVQTQNAGALTLPNQRLVIVAWIEPVISVDAANAEVRLSQAASGCPTSFKTDWTSNNVRCLTFPFRL